MGSFDAYEAEVLPLVQRHGGRVELRVRATDGSREFHLLSFPDEGAFKSFRADPRRAAAQEKWRLSGATISALDVEPVG